MPRVLPRPVGAEQPASSAACACADRPSARSVLRSAGAFMQQQPRHPRIVSAQSPRLSDSVAAQPMHPDQVGRSILTTVSMHSNAPDLYMRREMQMAMLQADRDRLATHKMVMSALEVASEQGRRAAKEEAAALLGEQRKPSPARAAPGGSSCISMGSAFHDSVAQSVQRLEDAVADRDHTIAALQTEPRRLQQLVAERDREIATLNEKALAVDRAVANAVAERDRTIAVLKNEASMMGTQLASRENELKLTRKQLTEQAEAHAKSLMVTRKLESAAAEMNVAVESRDAAHDRLLAEVRTRSESSTASLQTALAEAREHAAKYQAEASAMATKAALAEQELERVRESGAMREDSLTKSMNEALALQHMNARQQEGQLVEALREAKQVEASVVQAATEPDSLSEAVAELQVAKLKAQHAVEAQKLEAVRLEANQASYVMALQTESAAREAASATREAQQAKAIESMQAEIRALKLSLKVASEAVRESNTERDRAMSAINEQVALPTPSTVSHVMPPASPMPVAPQPLAHQPPTPTLTPTLTLLPAPSPTAHASPANLARPNSAPSALAAGGTGESVGSVFRRFDTDGRGLLDVSQLRQALTDLGVDLKHIAAAAAVAKLEASDHAGLTLSDFRKLRKALLALPPPAPSVGDVWRRAADASGLDASQLPEALGALGLSCNTPGAAAELARQAQSSNSRLSLDAFRKLCKTIKMCQSAGTGETVGQVFKRFDSGSGGGTLPVEAVGAALNDLGFPVATQLNEEAVACLADAGVIALSLTDFRVFVKSVKAGKPDAAPVQPPTPPPPALPPSGGPDGQWVYMDPTSSVQGPFTANEICGWIMQGSLPLDLQMRPVASSTKDLRPLSELLAPGGALSDALAAFLLVSST